MRHSQAQAGWCAHCRRLVAGGDLSRRARLGRWLGRRYDRLLARNGRAGRWNAPVLLVPGLAAVLLATLVYAAVAVVLAWSGWLLLFGGAWAVRLNALAGLVFLLWIAWPRFSPLPDAQNVVRPDVYPALDAAVQEIADALGIEQPLIQLSDQYAAAFGQIGPRRQPVLLLGYPLLSLLTADEFVALVAHELGHRHDGALTRNLYVRHAMGIIARLAWPGRPGTSRNWRVLFRPLRALHALFALLTNLDLHRGELTADAQALRIAGSAASAALLKKSTYGGYAVLRADPQGQRQSVGLQPADIETVWRAACREPASAWQTHPSLLCREAVATAQGRHAARIVLDVERANALRGELEQWFGALRGRRQAAHAQRAPLLPSAAD